MVSPELLRAFRFFGGLTDDQLRGIGMIAEEVSFPPRTVISKEGDVATKLYVLVEGGVELLYNLDGPGQVSNAYVGAVPQREVFNVSAMVEPYRLTASTVSEGAVRVIAVDAAGLRAMSEVDCRLGYTVMCHLAQALAERLGFCRIQLAASKPT